MNYLMLPGRSLFICDTHEREPECRGNCRNDHLAAEQVKRFGLHPKVACCRIPIWFQQIRVGTQDECRSRPGFAMTAGELEVDGEMHGDAALNEAIRREANPDSPLKGEANLLVMPNIDAANIYNLIKMTGGEGVTIGPILLGAARPVHVLTSTATVRRLVNMTALAVVESMER
jgi:malate dehydrogenase (oxaloacetate-decarboxylating)(NADP+)